MTGALQDALARFAVGPEVRLTLGADGGAEAALVCWALDAAVYERYESLGRTGGARLAERYLAAAVAHRLEGVDIEGEVAEFGSLGAWFLEHPFAGRLASDLMPEYLDAELPTEEDLDALEFAVYAVLDEQSPDRNPYEQSHREGCGHEIWEDRDAWKLADPMGVDPDVKDSEGKCRGCLADRCLYARVIKAHGTGEWVVTARRALERSRYLEQFPAELAATSARDWLYVSVARAELSKREAYVHWEARESSREQARAAKGGR